MPTVYELKFADMLRDSFGVSFDTNVAMTPKGISISARPSSDGHDMLRVEGLITSKTRLQLTAHPESYSRPLVNTMARAKIEMKQRCAHHLDMLFDDERIMSFRFCANQIDLRSLPVSEWPKEWDALEYGFTVFPLHSHEATSELLDEGFKWLITAFRPLFDLLEVNIEYDGYTEGEARRVLSTEYERDRRNREICISHHGAKCSICGFDFGATYGPVGEGFIHVHHIVPISKLGPGYRIDPVNDLIPVCPNCHAILHRFDPPMSPDELKTLLTQRHAPH